MLEGDQLGVGSLTQSKAGTAMLGWDAGQWGEDAVEARLVGTSNGEEAKQGDCDPLVIAAP